LFLSLQVNRPDYWELTKIAYLGGFRTLLERQPGYLSSGLLALYAILFDRFRFVLKLWMILRN
ncbi:MAG: hypothetical protein VW437_05135, partial [Betaproteobacteria bacterium]